MAQAQYHGEAWVETDAETMDYVLRSGDWRKENGGPGFFFYKSIRLCPRGARAEIEKSEKINFGVQMHKDPSTVVGR